MPSSASASATRARLPAAALAERDVELALHAHLDVPGRLAVADRDDPRGLAGVRLVRRRVGARQPSSRRFSV